MIMRHGESIGHSFEYVTELVVMRARETDEHFAARIWQAAEDQTKDLGPLSCQLNWARL